ncbi:hypothetical protein MASR1M8_04700 [Thermomonas brevis]
MSLLPACDDCGVDDDLVRADMGKGDGHRWVWMCSECIAIRDETGLPWWPLRCENTLPC